jgi:hypothetical protein
VVLVDVLFDLVEVEVGVLHVGEEIGEVLAEICGFDVLQFQDNVIETGDVL